MNHRIRSLTAMLLALLFFCLYTFLAGCQQEGSDGSSVSRSGSGSDGELQYAPSLEELERLRFGELSVDDIDKVRRFRSQFQDLSGFHIPAGAGIRTRARSADAFRAFVFRGLETYAATTKDPPAAKTLGKKLIEGVLQIHLEVPDAPSWQAMHDLAQQCVEAGSKDPLIAFCRGAAARWVLGRKQAGPILEAAAEALEKSSYSRLYAVIVRKWLVDDSGSDLAGRTVTAVALSQVCADWIANELKEPADRRLFWRYMDWIVPNLQAGEKFDLYRHVLEREHVDPWMLHMLAGTCYADQAWDARTAKWAKDVTEQQWKDFGKQLELAKIHLMTAWQLDPSLPSAPAAMIAVSMGGGDRFWSPRQWFLCAAEAELDYWPAYSRLKWALNPRWCGSLEELVELAKACVDTQRFDTEVPYWSVTCLDSVQKEIGRSDSVWRWPGVYELLLKMVDGYDRAEQYPDSGQPETVYTWRHSLMAAVAIANGRYDKARELLDPLGERVERGPFLETNQERRFAVGLAFARTGKTRELARRIQSYLAEDATQTLPELDEALTLVDQAVSEEPDKRAQAFYRFARVILQQLHDFHSNKWCHLTFDKNLTGWMVAAPVWEVEDENTIRMEWRQGARHWSGPVQLRSLVPFPPPYMVEVDLLDVPPETSFDRAGVLVGDCDHQALHSKSPGVGFFFAARYGRVGLWNREVKQMGWSKSMFQPPVRLRVKVWDGAYELEADGKKIVARSDEGFIPGRLLAFGEPGKHLVLTAGQVRFRRILVRKLNSAKASIDQ